MNSQHDKNFLTTKEVASLLNVNEKMVYSLINDKGLPATKVTGKWLFPRRTVEEWLESQVVNLTKKEGALSKDGLLLIAGSDDPLLQRSIALFHSRSDCDATVFYANIGSMGGLNSLRRGQCHIGICHLMQDDESEYNFQFAEQELAARPVLVNFSKREQGVLLAKGNPKKIRQVADLAKPGIRIANRPIGTGTRLLLDYEIAKSDVSSNDIDGYQKEFSRHLDVGLEVLSGRVDAAPAISAVAGILGLDFLPLRWERFDLLIAKEIFFEQKVQHFISMLQEDAFRQLATSFTGYDLSLSGKIIYPK